MHRIDLEITGVGEDSEEEGEPDSSIEPEERQIKAVERKKKKVQETRGDTEDVAEEEEEAITGEGVDISEAADISEAETEEVCSGVDLQDQ